MWKLTITQKRKSEYTDGMLNESIEIVNDNILELTSLIDKLVGIGTAEETVYKIEKVGAKNE